ncbi:hypothetical protein SSX86_000144 [Deinandra increscens subsp. villosa]|uniref:Uncharacterized protein n=1 Tax=Deinandra increscens subsp. villosa TaxID=3103831 RepID=A0AAP0HD81_9ASTR
MAPPPVGFDLHRSLAQELNDGESYGYRPLNTLSLSVTESENPPRGRKSTIPDWINGPVHLQLFTKKLLEKAVADYGVAVVIGKVKSVEAGGGEITAVVERG